LLASGTPAPWQVSKEAIGLFKIHETAEEMKANPNFCPGLGHCYNYEGRSAVANCELVVAAINALPALLAIAEAADGLRLAMVEDGDAPPYNRCWCASDAMDREKAVNRLDTAKIALLIALSSLPNAKIAGPAPEEHT
jgi:hypothetical protein